MLVLVVQCWALVNRINGKFFYKVIKKVEEEQLEAQPPEAQPPEEKPPEAEPFEVEPPQPDDVPEIVRVQLREEPLSSREMYWLSRWIVDWDSLAGLMDIAKEQRDHIRKNNSYYDDRDRAEKILSVFNRAPGFTREKLVNCLKGIKKLDLIVPVITGVWRKL